MINELVNLIGKDKMNHELDNIKVKNEEAVKSYEKQKKAKNKLSSLEKKLVRLEEEIQKIEEQKEEDVIEIGGIKLNTLEKNVYVEDEKISLTSIEYKILELLMKNPNRVFSIEDIYEIVWNEPAIEAKTVTVHIRRIREKIEVDPKKPMYLKVAWGLGYKFVDPKRRS